MFHLILETKIYFAPETTRLRTTFYDYSPSPGGGGILLGIPGEGVQPGSLNPDPISDKKMSFSRPVFRRDLKSTPVFRPGL